MVRHYKVKREGPKYVIDVEEPVSIVPESWEAHWRGRRPFPSGPNRSTFHPQFSCASLHAVVNYFMLHTKKTLVPFLLDEDYEKVLGR